jgi:dTDP-4-dehydrorhamnose 3,5-epimerase-like enzyme
MRIDSTRSPDIPRSVALKRRIDDYGWFCETFHEQRLRDIGITCGFVQDNQSRSKRAGTLRGLHFQVPPGEEWINNQLRSRDGRSRRMMCPCEF